MKHLEIENYKLHILAQIAHHHHQKSEHDELTLLKPWQKFDLLWLVKAFKLNSFCFVEKTSFKSKFPKKQELMKKCGKINEF